ncbi:transposase [Cytophagaceae bacterium ABcell3]|nr:transposase [Cytophagaceae bacterium ABcell3]
MYKPFYRRNLPHIQPKDGIFFITYRLYGSLPKQVHDSLKQEIELLKKIKAKHSKPHHDNLFEKYETFLDKATYGPVWLKQKDIAKIVANSFHYLDSKDYRLICYTVMANHVHLIIDKCQRPLYKILQSLKRHTAIKCNAMLRREGVFWQKESYDNLIKNMEDLANKINYTLDNPVKAGYVKCREDYEFSYCNPIFLKYL